jgi:hypothetical protein
VDDDAGNNLNISIFSHLTTISIDPSTRCPDRSQLNLYFLLKLRF